MASSPIRIVLCSMVRNESRVIRRMIDSTRGVCEHCVITDTGSTDDTVEILQGMEGGYCTVFQTKFVNFGISRTESIQNALRWCRENPPAESGRETWLLLLDADMILQKKDSFDPSFFKGKECVMLRQTDTSMSYFNIRLIHASLDWQVCGVTHEYTDCKTKKTAKHNYHGLAIDDRNDGGFKADKFERDLRLLLQGLYACDDGIHLRYLFYIAQTYMCMKNYKMSKMFHTFRIENKERGFDEEVFISYFRRGLMQNRLAKMLRDFDLAYEYMPDRIESMVEKARVLYNLGKFEDAWESALCKVVSTPMPKNRGLFIDLESYYDKRDILLLGIVFRVEKAKASVPDERIQQIPFHLQGADRFFDNYALEMPDGLKGLSTKTTIAEKKKMKNDGTLVSDADHGRITHVEGDVYLLSFDTTCRFLFAEKGVRVTRYSDLYKIPSESLPFEKMPVIDFKHEYNFPDLYKRQKERDGIL